MKTSIAAAVLIAVSPSLWAAVLSGHVLDRNHRPVTNATVVLEARAGERQRVVQTGRDGDYRFDHIPPSTYSIRVKRSGFDDASVGPFTVREEDVKEIGFTLTLGAPDFFDEPKFVVAGVTAGGYQGGHGSDVVLRSADALAKAMTELSTGANGAAEGGSAAHHHRLAINAETSGNFLEAGREYQRAAELDPSEDYLFDLGTELLRHHADVAAVEVFTRAHIKYAGSVRMLLGLATAYYCRGAYDRAAEYFLAATDTNPIDPLPYVLLGKVQTSEITRTEGFLERMKRFARLQPDNAQANYLYAVALWNIHDPEARLKIAKAIELDPTFGSAYLILGIIDEDSAAFSEAIANFRKAVSIDPALEEAHYRLAQTYRRTGDPAGARRELAVYEQLRNASADRVKREREAMQQFVIDLVH